jgi:hypothetical protein
MTSIVGNNPMTSIVGNNPMTSIVGNNSLMIKNKIPSSQILIRSVLISQALKNERDGTPKINLNEDSYGQFVDIEE